LQYYVSGYQGFLILSFLRMVAGEARPFSVFCAGFAGCVRKTCTKNTLVSAAGAKSMEH
jgi:hypothetical protein